MSGRAASVRSGVRLEAITVVWMVAEAALAIGAGAAARSVLLTAFGLDSVVELSGVVLLWRLSVEHRRGELDAVDRAEARATRLSAVLLVGLCLYVAGTAGAGAILRVEPERSSLGIGVAVAAVVVMPLLARSKGRVNRVLQSPALRAHVAETVTCAYMAATVVGGLVLHAVLGWWWGDRSPRAPRCRGPGRR